VPPVATYVDDTALFVNLRLQDLDHVEILRGPQGTLYGSGSLGGTIRFVQNAPDPTAFDAKIETGLSKTAHTHAMNEDVSAMVNLPITDSLAVRLNASWTDEAGFINQPNLYVLNAAGEPVSSQPGNLMAAPETYSKDGTNSYGYRTARIATLFKPNDVFKAQLSYYYQISDADGFPYAAPSYGVTSLTSTDHTQATTKDKVDLFALTMDGDLGFATLTSNSSYGHHVNQSSSDLTNLYSHFSFYNSVLRRQPARAGHRPRLLDDKPWAQEIRLASKAGGFFDWVGGLFYKDETTIINEHEFYPGYYDYYNACVPIYGAGSAQCGLGIVHAGRRPVRRRYSHLQGSGVHRRLRNPFQGHGAFGELTAHLTSDWRSPAAPACSSRRCRQSQQTGLLFGRRFLFARYTRRQRIAERPWRGVVEAQHLVSAGQGQPGVRHLVPGLPSRQRERACRCANSAEGYTYRTACPRWSRIRRTTTKSARRARSAIGFAIPRRSTTSNGTTSRRARS
jgi:outer membrane receptor protein involved in Fe transport